MSTAVGNGGPNGWIEYRKLVLQQLQDLNKSVAGLREDQTKMRESIAGLNVKSGAWGVVGGAIPVVIAVAIWLLKSSAGAGP